MSQIIYEPIKTIADPVDQDFRIRFNGSMYALRLHLLKYGNPTGNLVVQLLDGAEILKEIITPFATLIAETSEDYSHGMYRFDLDMPIRKRGEYVELTIRVYATDYIVSDSDFFGFVKNWKKEFNSLYGDTGNITDGDTYQDTLKPYHFELYEYIN